MGELKGWKELIPGGIIAEAGNAREYKTGDWRTEKPELNLEKCINCFFCWAYCPDNAVIVDAEAGKMVAFNYDYCKGCGICASICPAKGAITMVEER
ncbi:MAG: 4Fe-4S binding protein [Candidatus Atribacteria bacterium]|nr:4Fe-4S binding protein [Candidatus Atribacteria bacterium]